MNNDNDNDNDNDNKIRMMYHSIDYSSTYLN